MTKFLIVAGEVSGERYGARLMREIKAIYPQAGFAGIGGDMMRAEGLDMLYHCRDMAAIGIGDVVGKFRFFLGVIDEFRRRIRAREFDAVILIDYAGFNFRMAKEAKKCGIPVSYYVLPQIWAWRKYRIKGMKKYVDNILSVFPFEPEFYKSHGVHAHFVGHPMLDEISPPKDATALKKGYLPAGCETLVGMLPGSRTSEVRDNLATLVKTADMIREKMPKVGFVIPSAPHIDAGILKSAVGGRDFVRIVDGGSHNVMAASDFLIVKSGTSALEAALFRVPTAVVYRTSHLNYWVAMLLVRVKFGSLGNLIADKEISREFYQADFTAEKVSAHVLDILGSPEKLAAARKGMETVRDKLGGTGAAKRAAEIIVADYLRRNPKPAEEQPKPEFL